MTLTPPQAAFIFFVCLASAVALLSGCALLGEPGRAPLWETQNRQSH